MAVTQIYTQLLVPGVRGGDQPDAGAGVNFNSAAPNSTDTSVANGIVPTTAADGWVVNPPMSGTSTTAQIGQLGELLIFRITATTADTVVFKAGDRYPAHRADLGDLSIALATNDSRMICIESSRHLQNDGTILVTCGLTTTALAAHQLPKAN